MKDQNTPTNTLRDEVLEILRYPHNKKPERFTIATQIRYYQADQLVELLSQAVNKARSSELRMIETAQQDYDKWSGFCMDDTSDFGNYIEQRIKELETPNQVEGEDK